MYTKAIRRGSLVVTRVSWSHRQVAGGQKGCSFSGCINLCLGRTFCWPPASFVGNSWLTQEGKAGLGSGRQAVFSRVEELLTLTGDMLSDRKSTLWNSWKPPLCGGNRVWILGGILTHIPGRGLLSTRYGLDSPSDAEASGYCWAVSADTPLQFHVGVNGNACGMADRGDGSHFYKGGPEGVLQLSWYHTAQPPWKSLCQGAGKCCRGEGCLDHFA